MEFKDRSDNFQVDLVKLQKKYSIELYATIALLQNGEITPLIKLRDVLPLDQVIDLNKKYDNNPKKGNLVSEKA